MVFLALWRIIREKIPTDDILEKRGFTVVSKCSCCITPQQETIDHMFSSSVIASAVWSHFLAGLNIHSVGDKLQHRLYSVLHQHWHSTGHKFLAIYIICNIVWELWLNRNSGKHEGVVGFYSSIIQKIHQPTCDIQFFWQKPESLQAGSKFAEASALLKGLQTCSFFNQHQVDIELDSKVLGDMVHKTASVSWQCELLIRNMQHLLGLDLCAYFQGMQQSC